jgi:hypothetical protein
MDKEERNRRRRERYAERKEAGLSRSQQRSLSKAIQQEPTLIEKLVGKVASRIFPKGERDSFFSLNPDANKAAPKTKEVKQVGTTRESFADFVRRNPDKSANTLLKEYRKETGSSIGNERGKAIIREVREKPKETEKVTRIKYRAWDDVPGGATRRHYIKGAKFFYIVKYQVKREGYAQPSTEYMTLTSNEKLSVAAVREKVMEHIGEQELHGNAGRKLTDTQSDHPGEFKYQIIDIVDGSIEVLYAVDMSLPTKQ